MYANDIPTGGGIGGMSGGIVSGLCHAVGCAALLRGTCLQIRQTC